MRDALRWIVLAWMFVVTTLLTGCRLHFDETTDGANPTGDAIPSCVAETCNGIDDNCDGAIDEGCGCTPFERTITVSQHEAGVAVAWTGTGYLVAAVVSLTDSAVFAVTADGVVGPPQSLGDADIADAPAASVWTGSEHLIAYYQANAIWIVRVDAAGNLVAPPTRIDDVGMVSTPVLARRGNRVGAAWRTGPAAGSFVELDLAGTPVTASQPIAALPFSIVRAEDRYLIGGQQSGVAVVLALPDAGGSSTAQLGSMDSFPKLVWRPLDALVLETPLGSDTVRAVALDGTPAATPQPIPMFGGFDQSGVGVASTPGGYRVIGYASGNPVQLLRTELDPSGRATSGPTPFGTAQTVSNVTTASVLATAGRELVVMPYREGSSHYRLVHSCL